MQLIKTQEQTPRTHFGIPEHETLLDTGQTFNHAIVIGSGIAGLTAARVLSDYFNLVTVIERDYGRAGTTYRPGVPQAQHAHTLLPRGQKILEQLFPGFVTDILAQGAIAINSGRDIAFYDAGTWRVPRRLANSVAISSSQPLLETTIYRRVAAFPNVQFLPGFRVTGLLTDEQRRCITGVRLQARRHSQANLSTLRANLVVDASGRFSQASQWLEALGYSAPKEMIVNAWTGYATQIFQRPPKFEANWKKLYIRPAAPLGTRGGIILPIEGDRWCITLIGLAGDYPPTNPDGFIEFARSLPSSLLFEAIQGARLLTKPIGYRRTENRWRQFEKMPRYLEGFLGVGDAVYTLNPIYAQGMTTAAIGSWVLDECLKDQRKTKKLDNLAQKFQQKLGQALAPHWRQSILKDQQWPKTVVKSPGDPRPPSSPQLLPAEVSYH